MNERVLILDESDPDADFSVRESILRVFEIVPLYLEISREMGTSDIDKDVLMTLIDNLLDHAESLPVSRNTPSIIARSDCTLQSLETGAMRTVKIEVKVTYTPNDAEEM